MREDTIRLVRDLVLWIGEDRFVSGRMDQGGQEGLVEICWIGILIWSGQVELVRGYRIGKDRFVWGGQDGLLRIDWIGEDEEEGWM